MTLRPPDPPLEDAVVSLRPLEANDIATVEAALDDPEICRWFDNLGVSPRDVVERAATRWQSSEAAEFALLDAFLVPLLVVVRTRPAQVVVTLAFLQVIM